MKAIWNYFNAEQINLLITLKSRDSEHKDSTHHSCDLDHCEEQEKVRLSLAS